MIDQFLHNSRYSDLALYAYYFGALFWLITYVLVIVRIVKFKSLEFPAVVIAANVAWELLWGFVFKFSFGGPILQYSWRFGFLMDAFMLYSAFRFAKSQVDIPALQKYIKPIVALVFLFSLALIYLFAIERFDLPMGFNSGMLLNVFMSVLCILYLLRRPNFQFSLWIGISRFIATDIFFTIYVYNVNQNMWFSMLLCWTCFALDLTYIYLVYQQRKSTKTAITT